MGTRKKKGWEGRSYRKGRGGKGISREKQARGAGDIFLSGAAALGLAPVSVPLFLFLSASSAAIAGMVLLFLGRMSRREGIPFCPFIALGGVAAYGAEVFQLPFFPSWHCFI